MVNILNSVKKEALVPELSGFCHEVSKSCITYISTALALAFCGWICETCKPCSNPYTHTHTHTQQTNSQSEQTFTIILRQCAR